jgi:hypothetical protein
VAYVDVGLIPQYHFIYSKCRLSLGAGLMASVQLSDKTEYLLKETEPPTVITANDYDFRYQTDEPSGAYPFPGYCVQLEFEYQKLTSFLTIKRSSWKAPQIFPLDDQTRFTTVEFALGYYFN